jgi:hypothetical protein
MSLKFVKCAADLDSEILMEAGFGFMFMFIKCFDFNTF